ncbi:rhodanese-like domain-containing protein [Thermasporomyces composti]|uniref:Rhodanese-related sulfurtransferase n=1 Tax=Thermasporomyces composti TaxID=696763 RepID=A0A3D9V7V9_THECX|nr:rhodanese-like domain-containing protein [Thermasporomyces composti]REF37376.1 rhodanese-related sulfurtransferase [Thermasporomyces composti]
MPADAEEIDLAMARAIWEAGGLIVDVRTPEEYAAGHIPGAINVPVDRIAFHLERLPPGQVVTVCSMGNRARRGAERFARLGRPAMHLRGGTKAWAAAGYPLVTGPDPGEWRPLARRVLRRVTEVLRHATELATRWARRGGPRRRAAG